MKTWISIAAMLITTLLAPIASAGQLAAVSIINQATGERLPIWRHQGVNYVAGRPGDRYAIEIRNKTDERILSVLSVDGINVLTGSNASPTQAGYVLNTWQTMEVKAGARIWMKWQRFISRNCRIHMQPARAAPTM